MGRINYNDIVANLERWLASWRTKDGRYLGPVVHRRDLKRLKLIHDTPWSQAEIINGYLTLYSRTGNAGFLEEAVLAANAQAANILPSGEYRYAGHEDDRFSSLIHNALADCALLNVATAIKDKVGLQQTAERLTRIVEKNIDEYFINVLYDEKQKVFAFSRVDYYSIKENRCVCNMNAIAAEAMIKISSMRGYRKYDTYIYNISNWIKQYVNRNEGINKGAISYSHTQPDDYISIYTALCVRGLCSIYAYLKDKELLSLIELAMENLVSFTDNNMFMHESCSGVIYSKPWFVSGSGMIFNAIHIANQYINNPVNEEKYLIPYLKYQLKNGAFINFIGYDSYGNRFNKKGKGIKVWEDVFPTIGWNAQMFSFLANYVDENFVLEKKYHNIFYVSLSFIYAETAKHAFVASVLPLRSNAFLFYDKKRDKAISAINLLDISRMIRGLK